MKDIQKSIKLVESFDAVGKKSKLQELAQKQIASVAGLQEDANLVGSIASALVKYCKHAETTPMDMSPADQLRCLPASLNQKLTAMDKNQRSDILKQAEKQAYTQMLGDDGEYDTDRLDELSNTTLNSYASKARGEANWAGGKEKSLDTWATDKEKDQFRNSNSIVPSVKYNKEADPLAKHSQKRFAGAATADKKAGMKSSSQSTPYDWDKKGDSAVAGKPGTTRSIREQALQHSGQRSADSAGGADSYYGRARTPNKSENGVKIYDLTPEEITAYNTAYDANEESQDFKDWGRGNLEEVSLGNYTAKAAKSKALAQMDKAFGYGGDGNSNADSTIKKRTAGLERAQERTSKSKDAAAAKAKEDNRASDIANKEKYEKQLAELKGQFDSQYDRSDDHSYWTKHKEMAAKIKDLEKRLAGISEGFVDAMRSKNYSRLVNRSLDTAANIIDQENAETDVGPEFMQHMDKYEKRKSRASAINAKQHANAVTESADAASAITLSPDALISILKLAGMQPYAPGAQSAAPQTGMLSSIPTIAVGPAPQPSLAALSAMIPDDLCIDSEEGIEEGGEPQYSNSPDEEYCDTDAILASGNDMHRSKGTYPKVAGGDNPMAMSETEKSQDLDDLDLDDELEMLDLSESELMKQFKTLSKK